MKIAYLILVHEDPMFVERLSRRLTNNSNNHCFIHADAKTRNFDDLIKASSDAKIHWIANRIPVYWGGYSIVLATLSLLEESIRYRFDRYVIFHGGVYPLFDNEYITAFFETNNNVEFINAVDESTGKRKDGFRYATKNYLDRPNVIKRIKNKMNIIYWNSMLPQKDADCMVEYDGIKHHIYRGWGHFAITHELAEYIISFSNKHPEYNQFFKYVYVPDESYFHTIVYNSEFIKRTPNMGPLPDTKRDLRDMLNVTYFEYPSEVREFRYKDEYEYLHKKGYLFFRKASSNSKELLDYIDTKISGE